MISFFRRHSIRNACIVSPLISRFLSNCARSSGVSRNEMHSLRVLLAIFITFLSWRVSRQRWIEGGSASSVLRGGCPAIGGPGGCPHCRGPRGGAPWQAGRRYTTGVSTTGEPANSFTSALLTASVSMTLFYYMFFYNAQEMYSIACLFDALMPHRTAKNLFVFNVECAKTTIPSCCICVVLDC